MLETHAKPETISVEVVFYRLDVSEPAQAEAWSALQEKLLGAGYKFWAHIPDVSGGPGSTTKYMQQVKEGRPHAVETKHLFGDQYNSASVRLFDWYHIKWPNRDIREGYYIEPNAELEQAKRDRHVCGYCGHQEWNPTEPFCRECWGSEYLKAEELHMTLYLPVAESFGADRAKLAGELPAEMLERFTEENKQARMKAARARLIKRRAQVRARLAQEQESAQKKLEAFEWLVDQDLEHLERNMIYYRHKNEFCFGWLKPFSKNEAAALETGALLRFPFPFTVKHQGGE